MHTNNHIRPEAPASLSLGDTGCASISHRWSTTSTLLFPARVGVVFFLHISPLRVSSTLARCDATERCSSVAAGLLAGLGGMDEARRAKVHLVPPMDEKHSPKPPLPRSGVRLGSPSHVRVGRGRGLSWCCMPDWQRALATKTSS